MEFDCANKIICFVIFINTDVYVYENNVAQQSPFDGLKTPQAPQMPG